MDPQKIARTTGVLLLVTFVTAIPALLLYDPILKDNGFSTYINGAGADNQIFLGATLELILILANVATALVLFPILKRQNEILALGYVAARIVECVFIAVGILSVLAVVTLRQDASGADAATLGLVGQALVAVKDWTFLFGPGFIVGVGNGLILGYLMYSSGLVPRRTTFFGLVGGPLVCFSGLLVLFGVIGLGSTAQFVFTIPEIIWELFLGIYLTVKGFKPAPIIAGDLGSDAGPLAPQPA
ncbi:MAG TPA: DUF4386 domain-containing protein [Gaiellaceae bacterium]|nr:DUF4386 domain-containing protein [Gaiellaceae bacterium]